MKITKANGKAEYAVMENLKKRIDETDEKIVAIVSNIINEVKENGETIFTRNSTKDSFKFAIVFFNSKGKPFHVEYRTKMELGNPTFGRDCAHKFVEIEG